MHVAFKRIFRHCCFIHLLLHNELRIRRRVIRPAFQRDDGSRALVATIGDLATEVLKARDNLTGVKALAPISSVEPGGIPPRACLDA